MGALIRLAQESDAEGIAEIYTPIVENTAISFELTPPSVEEFRERIRNILKLAPWLVCDLNGVVTGYAYAGTFRVRAAYQWSMETSIYVHHDHRRKNIARALYTSLLELLTAQGFCRAIGGATLPNPPSVALHEAMGFRQVGVFQKVGYKDGEWHDVGFWEIDLRHDELPEKPLPLSAILGTAEWDAAIRKGQRLLKL